MSLTFYHKGVITFDKNLQDRIKRDSKRCWWHDEPDLNFTGYVDENNICYDVCGYGAWERVKKRELKEREYEDEFLKIKNTILESMNIITDFLNSMSEISDIKGNLRSLRKKIRDGYVVQNLNVKGGKKTRRYKKDNRRFLTEREISDLKEEISVLDNLETSLSKKIKFESTLERILENMYYIDEPLMHSYNNRFEWYETVGLYKDYISSLSNLKIRINHFTFNNIKEKYEIQNKDLDITLDEVTVFEETLDKIMERVEENKRTEEMMTVKRERSVTKKAKFYIDEYGNRVELDQNTEQIVIHR